MTRTGAPSSSYLDTPGLPAARKTLITRELKRTEAVLAQVHKETP